MSNSWRLGQHSEKEVGKESPSRVLKDNKWRDTSVPGLEKVAKKVSLDRTMRDSSVPGLERLASGKLKETDEGFQFTNVASVKSTLSVGSTSRSFGVGHSGSCRPQRSQSDGSLGNLALEVGRVAKLQSELTLQLHAEFAELKMILNTVGGWMKDVQKDVGRLSSRSSEVERPRDTGRGRVSFAEKHTNHGAIDDISRNSMPPSPPHAAKDVPLGCPSQDFAIFECTPLAIAVREGREGSIDSLLPSKWAPSHEESTYSETPKAEHARETTAASFNTLKRSQLQTSAKDLSATDGFKDYGWSSSCIIYPDSTKRNLWDVCSFTVLMYDLILIPYYLAWKPEESSFSMTGMWATMLFWTVDIVMSFNTGYYVNDEVEVRRGFIAKHYLLTAFVFDALVTGTDWVGVILTMVPDSVLDGDYDVISVLRLVKAQRALRVVRFLRVSMVWSRLERMHEMFLTDAWQILCQLITIMVGLFLVNHLVCCGWFFIGKTASLKDTGACWLDVEEFIDGTNIPYADFTPFYQYVTAYHWSVVQMFVGSTQINPQNSVERVYAISCNLFGTLFSAVITSWFAALLVRHQQMKFDYDNMLKTVRRYLRQNNVGPTVATRVQKMSAIGLSTRFRDFEEDIPAFKLLSRTLRAEMRRDIVSYTLFKSPAMCLLDRIEPDRFLMAFCDQMQYAKLSVGEELFRPGETTAHAYVVLRGCLHYTIVDDSTWMSANSQGEYSSSRSLSVEYSGRTGIESLNGAKCVMESSGILCGRGTWVSEVALWIQSWCTKGLMECRARSELISIDAGSEGFQRMWQVSKKAELLMEAYQLAYRALYKSVESEKWHDLVAPVDHAMVIIAMDAQSRKLAAEPVLSQLREKDKGFLFSHSPNAKFQQLEREVEEGECGLVFDAEGNAARVSFVVLLHAHRPDGVILVQIGKLKDGHVVLKLQKPGTKVRECERPADAAARILTEKLAQFHGAGSLGKCTVDEEVRPTENYPDLQTRFFSTEFHVPFEEREASDACVISLGGVKDDAGLRTSKKSRESFKDILPKQLYCVTEGPARGTIYAWMTPAAFDVLRWKEYEKRLHDWISGIEFPEHIKDASNHAFASLRSSGVDEHRHSK